MILTGAAIGPPGTVWPAQPALAGTPVYLSGSEIDPHVPAARARETARALEESGAVVEMRLFADRPHVVTREEIEKARSYLRAVAEA